MTLARILTFFSMLLLVSMGMAQGSQNKDNLQKLVHSTVTPKERAVLLIQIAGDEKSSKEKLRLVEEAYLLSKQLVKTDRANVLNSCSEILFQARNYNRFVELKLEEMELWRQLANHEKVASSHYELGKCYDAIAAYQEAISSYKRSAEEYDRLGMRKAQANSLIRAGVVYKDIENFSEAMKVYQEAYDIASSSGNDEQVASIEMNIGIVLKKQKNYDTAIEYYDKALNFYSSVQDNDGLANVHTNIGNILRLKGSYSEAIEHFNKSIAYRKKSSDQLRIGYTLNNIALVFMDQGNYQKSNLYLKRAEKHKLKYKDQESLATTYLNLAENYLKQNNYPEFERNLKLASDLAIKFEQKDLLRSMKVLESEYAAKTGDYKRAYRLLQSIHQELDTLDIGSQKVLSSYLEAQFNEKWSKNQIEKLLAANDELDEQKKILKKHDEQQRVLILLLVVLFVASGVMAISIYRKQRAFKNKSLELAAANELLIKTTISKEEKETLLKEIHHRVKNNLQIVKSLIRLRKEGIHDSALNDMLLDLEQRVSSIALVHESLYKSGNLAKVRVNEYYKSLLADLIDAYNLNKIIETDISIDIVQLDIDTLIPLGLITNEIISNSLKYAFCDRKKGKLTVHLSEKDGQMVLMLADDGPGFDYYAATQHSETLGIELIETLVEQISGELYYSPINGSMYTIKFAG